MALSKKLHLENGSEIFKMAAAKPEVPSPLPYKSKEILQANSMCSGSRNSIVLSEKIDVETGSEKFKIADAKTGCTCISAFIQESKEISTANAVFSGSGNSVPLLVMLYLKTGSQKFKMAEPNQKYFISAYI
jgi:hypothetical protein